MASKSARTGKSRAGSKSAKARKPAKKSAKKPAKKGVRKAAKKPARRAAPPARKSSPSAESARAQSAPAPAKALGKGVLIRLKRPAEKEISAAKAAANRNFTERSNGSSPITLHHRKPTKSELADFRDQLVRRRNQLMGDVKGLEAEAFSDETQVVSTNHLADSSFEQYEQEFNLSMIENESDELREIARAMDKISQGTFGVCESCGIDISIERLRAMPYTRVCIHCRSRFELEGNGELFGIVPERRV